MFEVYTAATLPFDRPTYGLVNLFNDPKGPQVSGDQYGDCYMVFHDIRDRVTVTAKDSLGHDNLISTLNAGVPAMMTEFQKGTRAELEKFASVASGKMPWLDSTDLYYKEIQIHGPLYFQENVSHVVVPDKYRLQHSKLKKLLQFCEKNGCWLTFPSTLRILADLRLKGLDELKGELTKLGVNDADYSHYLTFRPAVMCGPQQPTQRRAYDVLCNFLCLQDLKTARDLVARGGPEVTVDSGEGRTTSGVVTDDSPVTPSPSGTPTDPFRDDHFREIAERMMKGGREEGCPTQ